MNRSLKELMELDRYENPKKAQAGKENRHSFCAR